MKAAIVIAIFMTALAAYFAVSSEKAEEREQAARADLTDALFEVERLDAQLSTCMDIKHRLRAGESD